MCRAGNVHLGCTGLLQLLAATQKLEKTICTNNATSQADIITCSVRKEGRYVRCPLRVEGAVFEGRDLSL
jgi:hypothetical protein